MQRAFYSLFYASCIVKCPLKWQYILCLFHGWSCHQYFRTVDMFIFVYFTFYECITSLHHTGSLFEHSFPKHLLRIRNIWIDLSHELSLLWQRSSWLQRTKSVRNAWRWQRERESPLIKKWQGGQRHAYRQPPRTSHPWCQSTEEENSCWDTGQAVRRSRGVLLH